MGEPSWPEFLTADEVAAILRISRETVYRLIKNGGLTANLPGRNPNIAK